MSNEEPTKGQRQKDYRKAMNDKGLICKQFWVPRDDVSKVEAFVADLRNAHKETPLELEDDLTDLI